MSHVRPYGREFIIAMLVGGENENGGCANDGRRNSLYINLTTAGLLQRIPAGTNGVSN